MAGHWVGDKPFAESMITQSLMHIYVTWNNTTTAGMVWWRISSKENNFNVLQYKYQDHWRINNTLARYSGLCYCHLHDCINFLKPDDPYMRQWTGSSLVQGWGLLSQFLPFRYFLNFSSLSKHTLAVKYRVYIWQVSPQLSCGDTCQIWMWFVESNIYFCKIEYFAYGEINERSFSNPHPRWCFVTCSVPSNYQSEACYIVNRALKTNL